MIIELMGIYHQHYWCTSICVAYTTYIASLPMLLGTMCDVWKKGCSPNHGITDLLFI